MEKRYSKSSLVILGVIMLCFALGFGLLAYNLYNMIPNWFRYVAACLLALVAVLSFAYGMIMLLVSTGMNYGFKTHKDSNPVVNNVNRRLCTVCGKQVSVKAEYCDNCGAKLSNPDEMKVCHNCKAKNKMSAHFCEKCGNKFDEE